MAVAMDDNKAVARRQRQRGGRNNQIKMTFDSAGGWGRLMAVMMVNGEAVERSTVVMMDKGKGMVRQVLEAATDQEQETDAMSEDKSFKDQ